MNLPEDFACVECPEPGSRELVESVEGLAWVYILFCRNGTYYTGQSVDVQLRLKRHSEGAGARRVLRIQSPPAFALRAPLITGLMSE